MFPTIKTLDDVVPVISKYPEFGVYKFDNGCTISSYAISDRDTFLGEDTDIKRECRGITFGPNGDIVARTMHKFFNIGENASCQPNQIPWDDIARILVKEDGSMVTPLLLDGEVICKTKRSFDAIQAKSATEYLRQHPEKLEWVVAHLNAGITPTFEWVSPETPIVLTHYREPELILLQMRDMIDGTYHVTCFTDPLWRATVPFKVVEDQSDMFRDVDGRFSFAKLQKECETAQKVEGWVIQARDGRMWKMKTASYMALHHAVTFFRWRDLLKCVREETIDDLRAAFVQSGRATHIFDFVERYVRESIAQEILDVENLAYGMSQTYKSDQELVQLFKTHVHFSNAMRHRRGAGYVEGLVKDWFRKEEPKWSLAPIEASLLAEWNIEYEDAVKLAKGGHY